MDKTFKKLIASVSAAAIVATQALSAVVYGATNVSAELQSAVNWMIQNQFTSAQNVDQFNPYRTITRAEAAKFYVKFAENVLGKTPDVTKDCTFKDVPAGLAEDVKKAIVESCQLGLFKGENGNFYPTRALYKSEAIVVLVRALYGDQ